MASAVTWPLAMNMIRKNSVSNTFGMVRHYANGTPKPHQGWDFTAAVGTPAYAIADGTVMFVHNGGAYGLQVCFSFKSGQTTLYAFYAHMQTVTVKAGDKVSLNDMIGTTGKTGNAWNLPADEDHLHFEIREQAVCGLGLNHRLSPISVFGVCPLHAGIAG